MKRFYLLAMIIGAALPLYFFINFFAENGLGLHSFLRAAFDNSVSTAFTADLLLSAIIAFVFIGNDAKKSSIHRVWMVILGTCLVGLSFGLPLYLYFREEQIERRGQ